MDIIRRVTADPPLRSSPVPPSAPATASTTPGPSDAASLHEDISNIFSSPAVSTSEPNEGTSPGAGAHTPADAQGRAELVQRLAAQEDRRSELTSFLGELAARTDAGESGKLVRFPDNFHSQVEVMLRAQRGDYLSLSSWLDPHKAADSPMTEMNSQEQADPRIVAGLSKIRDLDDELKVKALEALVVERDTFPDKWAAQEAAQRDRSAQRVERLLKQQRLKQRRGVKLRMALQAIDENEGDGAGSEAGGAKGRAWKLGTAEESLLQEVLARDDVDHDADNPFDADLLEGDGEGAETMSMTEINERLEAYTGHSQWGSSIGGGGSAGASEATAASTSDDYLVQLRLAKEAAAREREVDERLRSLRVSTLPGSLREDDLRELVQVSRQQLQEAGIPLLDYSAAKAAMDEPEATTQSVLAALAGQAALRMAGRGFYGSAAPMAARVMDCPPSAAAAAAASRRSDNEAHQAAGGVEIAPSARGGGEAASSESHLSAPEAAAAPPASDEGPQRETQHAETPDAKPIPDGSASETSGSFEEDQPPSASAEKEGAASDIDRDAPTVSTGACQGDTEDPDYACGEAILAAALADFAKAPGPNTVTTPSEEPTEREEAHASPSDALDATSYSEPALSMRELEKRDAANEEVNRWIEEQRGLTTVPGMRVTSSRRGAQLEGAEVGERLGGSTSSSRAALLDTGSTAQDSRRSELEQFLSEMRAKGFLQPGDDAQDGGAE